MKIMSSFSCDPMVMSCRRFMKRQEDEVAVKNDFTAKRENQYVPLVITCLNLRENYEKKVVLQMKQVSLPYGPKIPAAHSTV
jgi:hypothetical protein